MFPKLRGPDLDPMLPTSFYRDPKKIPLVFARSAAASILENECLLQALGKVATPQLVLCNGRQTHKSPIQTFRNAQEIDETVQHQHAFERCHLFILCLEDHGCSLAFAWALHKRENISTILCRLPWVTPSGNDQISFKVEAMGPWYGP